MKSTDLFVVFFGVFLNAIAQLFLKAGAGAVGVTIVARSGVQA